VSKTGKGPLPLSEALQKYLSDSGLGERVDEAGVLPEWGVRVGPAIAAVTTPMRVSRGTLIVGVRSSAWLTELKMMGGEILRRINDGRQKGRIEKIRFVLEESLPVPPQS
jgi:predicted nucleic acid-binding Zn ribbon protein